jgi:hypothetical protein
MDAVYTYEGSRDKLVVSGGVQTFYSRGTGAGTVLNPGTLYTVTSNTGVQTLVKMTYEGSQVVTHLGVIQLNVDNSDGTAVSLTSSDVDSTVDSITYNDGVTDTTVTGNSVTGLAPNTAYTLTASVSSGGSSTQITASYTTLGFTFDTATGQIIVSWGPILVDVVGYTLTYTNNGVTQTIDDIVYSQASVALSRLKFGKEYTFELTVKHGDNTTTRVGLASYTVFSSAYLGNLTLDADPDVQPDGDTVTVEWGREISALTNNDAPVLEDFSTNSSTTVAGLLPATTYLFVADVSDDTLQLVSFWTVLGFNANNTDGVLTVSWGAIPNVINYTLMYIISDFSTPFNTLDASTNTVAIQSGGPTETTVNMYFGETYYFTLIANFASPLRDNGIASYTVAKAKHEAPSSCFLADAPVLTPAGYKPIASLRAGDAVTSADGRSVAIRKVRVVRALPKPDSFPFVIPAGLYGASQDLPISPHHLIRQPGKEARHLGLEKQTMTEPWDYYNLELEDHDADMVVAGVVVETWKPWDGVDRT